MRVPGASWFAPRTSVVRPAVPVPIWMLPGKLPELPKIRVLPLLSVVGPV